jgi:hypothetical protein
MFHQDQGKTEEQIIHLVEHLRTCEKEDVEKLQKWVQRAITFAKNINDASIMDLSTLLQSLYTIIKPILEDRNSKISHEAREILELIEFQRKAAHLMVQKRIMWKNNPLTRGRVQPNEKATSLLYQECSRTLRTIDYRSYR